MTKECKYKFNCDGINCVRAAMINSIMEGEGDISITKASLQRMADAERKIIETGECLQPQELEKAIKKLEEEGFPRGLDQLKP